MLPPTLRAIDSHTGGEPTRVVVSGGPELGSGPLAERLARLLAEHDSFRSAVVNEPRGSDILVGALLCAPSDPSCRAGAIFFNNVGGLGMCGHGTIGLMVTLAYLGRIAPGEHRIETPVGVVTARLHERTAGGTAGHPTSGEVSVQNVPSYRLAKAVAVDVPDHGTVRGDIAWGGNWFFLVEDHRQELTLQNVPRLTEFCWSIRQALARQGLTGKDGAEIDHVELFGPPLLFSSPPGGDPVDSRNFVLCPGKAYDRSPCGTGTSAKLACLYADGTLKPGQIWRQESILGSVFEGSIIESGGEILPTIKGSAFITADSTLHFDPADPFQAGVPFSNVTTEKG